MDWPNTAIKIFILMKNQFSAQIKNFLYLHIYHKKNYFPPKETNFSPE